MWNLILKIYLSGNLLDSSPGVNAEERTHYCIDILFAITWTSIDDLFDFLHLA